MVDPLKNLRQQLHDTVVARDYFVGRNVVPALFYTSFHTFEIDLGIVDADEIEENLKTCSPCMLKQSKLALIGKHRLE